MRRSISILGSILSVVLCAVLAACGTSSGGGGSTTFTPPNIQGQWYMQTTPASSGYYSFVNVNLSQTGADVSAGPQSVAIFSNRPTVGSTCGGTATISGTISHVNTTSGVGLSFTLTETGPNDTSAATVTDAALYSSPLPFFQSAPYTIPAGTACGIGYGGVSGSFIGVVISPFSGTYSGTLNGNPTTVTIAQGAGYTVTISGQTNMSAVALSGNVIGASFDATGTIGGSQVEWIGQGGNSGASNSGTVNTFLIFDGSGNELGRLNSQ